MKGGRRAEKSDGEERMGQHIEMANGYTDAPIALHGHKYLGTHELPRQLFNVPRLGATTTTTNSSPRILHGRCHVHVSSFDRVVYWAHVGELRDNRGCRCCVKDRGGLLCGSPGVEGAGFTPRRIKMRMRVEARLRSRGMIHFSC